MAAPTVPFPNLGAGGTSGSDQGTGQRSVSDHENDHSLFGFLVKQGIGRINTLKMVKVTKVTNVGALAPVGFVDVQPLVKQMDGGGKTQSHGVIHNVPYVRGQGGINAVIMDPKVGDIGYIGVADRDSSAVKREKAEASPGSRRRFSLSDGIYMGGILNRTPAQYLRFWEGKADAQAEATEDLSLNEQEQNLYGLHLDNLMGVPIIGQAAGFGGLQGIASQVMSGDYSGFLNSVSGVIGAPQLSQLSTALSGVASGNMAGILQTVQQFAPAGISEFMPFAQGVLSGNLGGTVQSIASQVFDKGGGVFSMLPNVQTLAAQLVDQGGGVFKMIPTVWGGVLQTSGAAQTLASTFGLSNLPSFGSTAAGLTRLGEMLPSMGLDALSGSGSGLELHDKNDNILFMDEKGITITDKNKNVIVMNAEGIKITDKFNNVITLDDT